MMWMVGAPLSFRQKALPPGCHQMLSCRTLEHTADVGFEAYGRSHQEVFANSVRALINIIVDLDSIEPCETESTIQISGADPQSVLVNLVELDFVSA